MVGEPVRGLKAGRVNATVDNMFGALLAVGCAEARGVNKVVERMVWIFIVDGGCRFCDR